MSGDMLAFPGGMPGTLNLAGNETLAALIRSYDDQERNWQPSAQRRASLV